MNAEQITALILTHDEVANINRSLKSLAWLPRILIVDSFSTDETVAAARRFGNVEVVQRRFDSFAQQCNWGLTHIFSEWVLSLDADYVLTPELVEEIRSLEADQNIKGYRARFRYCIYGSPLQRTLLPARTILHRRSKAAYCDEGHSHHVCVDGKISDLKGYILHDDRKPLRRWLQSQINYAEKEAEYLQGTGLKKESGSRQLNLQDRVRKMIFVAPLIMPFYLLIGYGLVLDGWRGWYYVFQRTLAEILLSLQLLEAKLEETPR